MYHKPHHHRRDPPQPSQRIRSWCCSFAVPPRSPENSCALSSSCSHRVNKLRQKSLKSDTTPSGKSARSLHSSPGSTTTTVAAKRVGRIDRRRILSPGRVSPIYSLADDSLQEFMAAGAPDPEPEPEPSPGNANLTSANSPVPGRSDGSSKVGKEDVSLGIYDVRLNLKGKNGDSLVLELNSEDLIANSSVFADLISNYRKKSMGSSSNYCRIEVPEVDNLNVFRETIELMFEEDIMKRLLSIGVYRSIDILKVSAGIMFRNGILFCFKYLEAMPWSEEEEEKLRSLFNKFKFDDATTGDIMARLYPLDSIDSRQTLARQLVWSITSCGDASARIELKSLVKGLLCKSSVYETDYLDLDLNKEDIFAVCQSCLSSLAKLMEEASGMNPSKSPKNGTDKPLLERISRQVDNINWLLEILLDYQLAEEFVDIWLGQKALLKMHESASPMVRYELSRVSAMLFIAMGTRKLHCRSETRSGLLETWFRPMLLDFGWLQRCKKGLDMRALEEAMGQALLTLPLKQQYTLFMEWFRYFSKHGTECPNLSKAFQIWWRRSFLRGSESCAIESI